MTKPTPAAKRAPMSDRLKAIGLMCAAVTLFSCLDATAKYLVSHSEMHTAQVVWLRFVGQALLMAVILGPGALPDLLRSDHAPFLAIGVQHLRLDQTISIAFLAPLVVAALAGPLLGEWVGWRRMVAICVGFLGILIVVRPGFTDVHWAFGIAFLSMLVYALFMLVTRKLSAFDPPLVTLFYALLVGTIGGAPFALANWVWPEDAWTWGQLLSMGAFGGMGHYLLILAYRLAPASSVTPFLYFQIISMVTLGYLVFGDVPDKWSLLGSAVVIGAGVYLVHREHTTSRTPPVAAE